LKELGIDLKPLFSSRILFHKIDNRNPNFNEFDLNLKYCIKPSNEKSLYDLLYSVKKIDFDKKFLIKKIIFSKYINIKD
jgi:hypothetical protein